MEIKTVSTAKCAVCKAESEKGFVISVWKGSTMTLRLIELQKYDKSEDTAEHNVKGFVCEDCTKELSGLSFIQLCKDDFELKEDSEDSDLKPISKEVVADTYKRILGENSFTTTLDIKNSLREENYDAAQNEISRILREFISEDPELNFIQPEDLSYRYYYVDSSVRVSFTLKSKIFSMDNCPTPVHAFNEFRNIMRELWNLSKIDVKENFDDHITYGQIEEFLSGGFVQEIWDYLEENQCFSVDNFIKY